MAPHAANVAATWAFLASSCRERWDGWKKGGLVGVRGHLRPSFAPDANVAAPGATVGLLEPDAGPGASVSPCGANVAATDGAGPGSSGRKPGLGRPGGRRVGRTGENSSRGQARHTD